MIALNRPSPISNLITTNQVYTEVKNYDNSQYFVTPIKTKHSDTKIYDKKNKTSQVQIKFYPRLCQYSLSTKKYLWNSLHLGNSIFVFKPTGKLTMWKNVTNKGIILKWLTQLLGLNNLDINVLLLKGYCIHNNWNNIWYTL